MEWITGLCRAVDWLEARLEDTPDVTEAARHMGCSVWDFQRMFRHVVGMPVGDYIRARRLTRAAEALTRDDAKVIDVALCFGYASHAAFSRAFRQQFGASPVDVRQGHAVIPFPRLSLQKITEGWVRKMSRFTERGYVIREAGPIYYTEDMERAVRWFEDTLGWYGDVAERDAQGIARYGCVFSVPPEVAATHVAPFTGIHLYHGAPKGGVLSLIMVDDIDALAAHVRKSGWPRIKPAETMPWARVCDVETVDGYVLRFFA